MLERELVFLLDIKGTVPQDIFCSHLERVRVEIVYFIYPSFFKRVEKQESERVREEIIGGN